MQLVWFRNDLRSLDHAGLTNALNTKEPVIGVFISTEMQWQSHGMAPIKRDFMYARVADLSAALAELNIPLILIQSDTYQNSVQQILNLCQKYPINRVHACADYELNERVRDQNAQQQLSTLGVKFNLYHDSVIFPPKSITKADGGYYSVFTAFKKQWLQHFAQHNANCFAKPQAQAIQFENHKTLIDWLNEAKHKPKNISDKLKSFKVPFSYQKNQVSLADIADNFPTEELDILNRLRVFCREQVQDYQHNRDLPNLSATSCLSAAFSLGCISPRQAINRLLAEQGEAVFNSDSGAATWLSELIWREFYRHLTAIYDNISQGFAVKTQYQNLKWRNDNTEFDAWCQGKTGFPIVDAAMRQLNQTGWMHNRLRMIVASFLIKDLQIDWRWGEQYFMQNLIDGDYAANNGGWQWSASTGHDAAPYFRIFNPTTQSERFDKHGNFIRKFCPELAHIKDKNIHKPSLNLELFERAGKYPNPIVDHKTAREITLNMYANK